jgi:hypothetical protein
MLSVMRELVASVMGVAFNALMDADTVPKSI